MTPTEARAEFKKYRHCGREYIPIQFSALEMLLQQGMLPNEFRALFVQTAIAALQERGFQPED